MRRVIRTGSFDWGRWGAQSVYRMRIGQRSTQHPHQGFRVAMRLKGVEGAPPAGEQRRSNKIDPGANSKQVLAALKAGGDEVAAIRGKLPKLLSIDLPGHVKMEFVLIPSGSFLMGSSAGFTDETPVHRVVISKPFYMAKYELTTAQWAALMGRDARFKFWESMKGEHDDATGPNKAMRDVSWDDCRSLIAKLKQKIPGLHTQGCQQRSHHASPRTALHRPGESPDAPGDPGHGTHLDHGEPGDPRQFRHLSHQRH